MVKYPGFTCISVYKGDYLLMGSVSLNMVNLCQGARIETRITEIVEVLIRLTYVLSIHFWVRISAVRIFCSVELQKGNLQLFED